jgi:hypothetical protein
MAGNKKSKIMIKQHEGGAHRIFSASVRMHALPVKRKANATDLRAH